MFRIIFKCLIERIKRLFKRPKLQSTEQVY